MIFILSDYQGCSTNPCLHGGTCQNTLNGEYTCQCPIEYEGDRCEVKGKITINKNMLYTLTEGVACM